MVIFATQINASMSLRSFYIYFIVPLFYLLKHMLISVTYLTF
jgi:hypothetical protein